MDYPVVSAAEMEPKFQRWLRLVTEMHAEFQFCGNPAPAWAPLSKPLGRCRVAVVSTAGVHLRTQHAFDLMNHKGDWSFREIPGDVRAEDLMASHSHYDTADANRDINCVFPIDTLRALADGGVVGDASPLHIGMMGFVPNGARLRDGAAVAVAGRLRDHAVDVTVLTPG